ncbi:MarR family transcriptional regulator [Luteimonas sp. BDR2-5]|uniref:MarR family winged helix-turn-helix transcriptional regulator n=1 Tax=Proluteimonas luteida TaxID=2878685 RepID=UPI001E483AE2|nr:MarR family transcriptional regulator [Luteimonas sp. BDR2-5]MCD9026722.1 MarR family transcriptional regulator [Luteimonas sp. BDR2-5]
MSMIARNSAPATSENGMPDFVETLGPAFLAHLLRRLSDELVEADRQWHAEAGIRNPPRTSSTLLALDAKGPMSVTALAAMLRQSHQLVMQWIRTLQAEGLVESRRDPSDARRTLISLTRAGREQLPALRHTIAAVEHATRALIDEIAPGIYDDLWNIERELRREPFVQRIRNAGSTR